MTGLLYIFQPQIVDLPPNTDPNALAWFAQFSSGHLRHADQKLVNWAIANGMAPSPQAMSWGEYERLLREAHWYDSV